MDPTAPSYFSIPPRNFAPASSRRSDSWSEYIAPADQADVRQFPSAQEAGRTDLADSGFSYRHDWGKLAGPCRLFLNWDAINPKSRVFVSITEGGAGAPGTGTFIGTANVRLYDVAPTMGGIWVRVHVDGGDPIRLVADYLVINA